MPDDAAPQVAIVDYGMGNLFSVRRACENVRLRAVITSSRDAILAADGVILPGVGAFGDAMAALRRLDLVEPLRDVAASGKPLAGICLGLQLLMSESEEFGRHEGLGLIEGPVVRFENPQGPRGRLKVPQVGWNRISPPPARPGDWRGTPLEDVPPGSYVYFVHSFYARPTRPSTILSVSTYGGIEFCSSLRRDNVVAFQFHPERSSGTGLKIYDHFARQVRRVHAAMAGCAMS